MLKAKVGDRIQSFDVAMPIAKDRGSYIGVVTKVELDEQDGCEYVHFNALYRLLDGAVERQVRKEMRAIQNGTPTLMGRETDGILVIGDE